MNRYIPLLVLAACVETKDPIEGTQSLRIELKSPTTGSIFNRLPDAMRSVVVDVTALDANNAVDTSYENSVQVYVNFLGTLTPYLGGQPLQTIDMREIGRASCRERG